MPISFRFDMFKTALGLRTNADAPAFEFFLRIRRSLDSHGMHEHTEHVAGIEK